MDGASASVGSLERMELTTRSASTAISCEFAAVVNCTVTEEMPSFENERIWSMLGKVAIASSMAQTMRW